MFIAFDNGQLLIVDVPSKNSNFVGTILKGISAVAWSPDEDLIVILTHEDSLILMSRSLDEICEKILNPEEFGAHEAITVGWGSKQTQFHGSEGKQSAKASNSVN